MMKRYCIIILVIIYSQDIFAVSSFFAVSDLEDKLEAKKIILIASDVEITRVTGNSSKDTSADWTLSAEKNIRRAFELMLTNSNYDYQHKLPLENHKLVELVAHQRLVEKSILANFKFPLPSKKDFDWSIGPDNIFLGNAINADYGLSVFFRAGFRADNQVAYQTALISVLELNTGKTVWFNAQTHLPGDLRHPQKSLDTLSVLLDHFPGVKRVF